MSGCWIWGVAVVCAQNLVSELWHLVSRNMLPAILRSRDCWWVHSGLGGEDSGKLRGKGSETVRQWESETVRQWDSKHVRTGRKGFSFFTLCSNFLRGSVSCSQQQSPRHWAYPSNCRGLFPGQQCHQAQHSPQNWAKIKIEWNRFSTQRMG